MEPLIFFSPPPHPTQPFLICTPPWSEESLFGRKKEERTKDVEKRQAGSLSPEAKVRGTKVTWPVWAHVSYFPVCEDSLICAAFHFVGSLLLQHGVCSALLRLFPCQYCWLVVAVTCLCAALIWRIIHLFCSLISAAAVLCINERLPGLFHLVGIIHLHTRPLSEEWRDSAH